jgi:hypothetical protein
LGQQPSVNVLGLFLMWLLEVQEDQLRGHDQEPEEAHTV